MILAGRNAVNEALKGGVKIEKIVLEAGLEHPWAHALIAEAKGAGAKVQRLPRAVMDKMCKERHRGVFAVAADYEYAPLERLLDAPSPRLVVLLDGVEDPHNLGAVVRAADCAGVNGVIIPRHRSAAVTEGAVRASAGATAYVPICKVGNLNDAVRTLKEAGFSIFAADASGSSVYDADLCGDVAFIIGGEDSGVRPLTRKLADQTLALPLFGRVNSLNASVAAGIFLYEAVRQRQTKTR